jgi:hypothetical protein
MGKEPRRNLLLQPKTAFSRLPPIHRADLKGQLRVDLTRSPNPSANGRYLRIVAVQRAVFERPPAQARD